MYYLRVENSVNLVTYPEDEVLSEFPEIKSFLARFHERSESSSADSTLSAKEDKGLFMDALKEDSPEFVGFPTLCGKVLVTDTFADDRLG